MKIGIDFDNTIADYDEAFFLAARDRDLVPGTVGRTKKAVKRYLLSMDRQDEWTELQGFVYGPGIERARPYPGLPEFLENASRSDGMELVVVSHKTRTPYRGPGYDLHGHAREWLGASGIDAFFGSIHFETSKEDKLRRIGSEACDVFVDDLPEILRHELFPASRTRSVLFDPSGELREEDLETATSWNAIAELLSEG